jgi:hypothetical protein
MSTCPATRLAWSIWVFFALFGATALVITFLGVSAGLSFLEFGAAFNAGVIAAGSRPMISSTTRLLLRLCKRTPQLYARQWVAATRPLQTSSTVLDQGF